MHNVIAKRQRDLMRSIREKMKGDRIWTPGQKRSNNWPICKTCGREPYYVGMEDLDKNTVEVRVKCGHKPYNQMSESDTVYEDWARINIPFGTTDRAEHINWCLRSLNWFDPTRPPK